LFYLSVKAKITIDDISKIQFFLVWCYSRFVKVFVIRLEIWASSFVLRYMWMTATKFSAKYKIIFQINGNGFDLRDGNYKLNVNICMLFLSFLFWSLSSPHSFVHKRFSSNNKSYAIRCTRKKKNCFAYFLLFFF
jgi:hypothetical protein